jgi:hypothetical protein
MLRPSLTRERGWPESISRRARGRGSVFAGDVYGLGVSVAA